MFLFHVLREALESIAREFRRIAPMAAGIVWGVASVFLLTAIGNGFERTQRQVIEAFGSDFLLLRTNKPTHSRSDPNALRRIMVDEEDIARIRAQGTAIDRISPKGYQWRAQGVRGRNTTWLNPVGVDPNYPEICNVPLEPGSRWLDAKDVESEVPVMVIGPKARQDLFGDDPAIGEKIKLTVRGSDESPYVREFTVIGVIRDVELSDDFYVSNKRAGFVTYPVFERICEKGAGFMVMKPKGRERKEEALAQVRAGLAERYHFDADDENTVLPYFDAIGRGERIDRVFGGIKLFLGAVGLLILLLGAVGVANVVLMSVTARTFEFGLRRAVGCRRHWIFVQVFLEAGLVCGLSGVVGFLLGLGSVELVSMLPLPRGFAKPIADVGAATLPAVLLLAVTIGAAFWPALRAVRLDPVEALRGGHL